MEDFNHYQILLKCGGIQKIFSSEIYSE